MTELELTKWELNTAKAHIKFLNDKIKRRDFIIEELKQKLRELKCANQLTRLDFLACVCASLLREPENEFETELGVGGIKFEIKIRKN